MKAYKSHIPHHDQLMSQYLMVFNVLLLLITPGLVLMQSPLGLLPLESLTHVTGNESLFLDPGVFSEALTHYHIQIFILLVAGLNFVGCFLRQKTLSPLIRRVLFVYFSSSALHCFFGLLLYAWSIYFLSVLKSLTFFSVIISWLILSYGASHLFYKKAFQVEK